MTALALAAAEPAPEWLCKLQRMVQTLAFALTVAALQIAFQPERPFLPPLTYSTAISLLTWLAIDFGRSAFPSARETGWPQGWAALALPAGGMVFGFVAGTLLADWWCGVSSWKQSGAAQLRLSVVVTALATTAAVYYFYSVNKSAYLLRKTTEATQQASEARLKLLETQLEPHMLFNTLANLRVLIGTDPPRAQHMLDHMIAYLRATLAASRSTTHSLAAEFERLRDYLELMAVRMGPRLVYVLDLPPDLAAQPVPALLLQPLVENSIQHGLEPQVAGGRITVSARREGRQLVLEVADTGVGMAPGAALPASAKGFGVAQVRERLATLYENDFAIDLIAAHARGVRAVVRFPLKT